MEICSKVEHNAQFCINLLSSHPETKTMDLYGLAQMVIDTANTKLQEIIAITTSLDQSTKDHVLKARYSSCSIYFAIAVNAMQVSKTCVITKKFSNIDLSLTSAKINVVNCRDNRMGGGTIPPNLAQMIQEFDCICQTGEAITRRLHLKN
ncbi:hypothetical protein JCGZ_23839 [Jatropha curcas]|uniref:Pectinesterase inhibitor domain-containing protein n=2 Tax=Jatropha curcas TaxID=180498 RepID=A0A067L3A2_JATCU|nr:hypothetical protein JCGZ_23839 [Jatropha curcas]